MLQYILMLKYLRFGKWTIFRCQFSFISIGSSNLEPWAEFLSEWIELFLSESDDQNVMEVGIEGRDDSEDDYDDEEFDENDEFESAHPAIPSADAFGKDDFYEKGTEKTTRKMKRDERNEIRKLEELDAKERRQQLHSLLETDLPQSERLVRQLQLLVGK